MSVTDTPNPAPSTTELIRENERKWGKAMMNVGWTAVPSIILKKQKQLGLDALDLNIILHLMSYWWTAGELPYPSKKTLAELMSVDESTIRRRIAKLEAGKLIKRILRPVAGDRHKSNQYDFSGLIEAVTPFAEEELAERAKTREQKAERARRMRPKKPTLTVI
ncbi:helix-turn-helix domain-containing protein [Agitococcus lubricus]|uniref:Helix-turn-helix protein n=1 Tax=Agitococcus lubricus TaxID=1077255 RepID=A0A2T5IQU7_9GAMM|nr:helix-turn-helix domain-containing protein [Agitococcus lubricus]PTQ86178.1 helix-turn-helix protein [Agitococcus lubricus]